MKKQKVELLKYVTLGENASGEEYGELQNTGIYIIGYISPGASSDEFTVSRESSENVITMHVEGIHDYINRNDRLLWLGRQWLIEGFPAIWQNSRGYRSMTVITATFVEG